MSLTITERTELESQKLRIEPQLVLEIDGVTTLFGAVQILHYIRIGDPELYIGDDWKIGGLSPVEDQEPIVSLDGTGTQINQQIYPDKGSVSSVSTVQVSLIDKNLIASRLISPGVVVEEILGRKATLWMGFQQTAWKEDYLPIFSGVIDDVESGSGMVKLNLAHPEQLKRQDIYAPATTTLPASITNSQTTIALTSVADFPSLSTGILTPDPTIQFYVRIEDEIIKYTSRSGNSLIGCTRGALGTLAVAHTVSTDPLPVKTLLSLQGTAVELALKIMLSGVNGYYALDVPITRYLSPDGVTVVPNSIFFSEVDLNRDYGLVEGDYVTVTGATNGANNFTLKTIQEIVVTDLGSYMVLNGVTLVPELSTAAVAFFRSQYDTLGPNLGLGMTPDEVDVAEHIYWNNAQLASYQYRFDIEEQINGKDFLDKEIYLPVGAYSIPRKGRCSMGYHVGPVLRTDLPTLNRHNVKDPDKIRLRRAINRNFYNTIVYQFDKLSTEDRFVSGVITTNQDSKNRIRAGNKVLTVRSSGIRRTLDGAGFAERVASRYLGRYAFAAEFFESISVFFKAGFRLEPGDLVTFNAAQLQITNTADGTRDKPTKIYEVTNVKKDLKTGDVQLALTDTNFDGSERYGVVSPSSLIVSGTTTQLLIQDSYGSLFPGNESRKWRNYLGERIVVHSYDWSFAEEVTLLSIDPGNRYRLNLDPSTPLSAPPAAGYIIDVPSYPTTDDVEENSVYKAAYVFMSATVPVVTGVSATSFTIGAGDVGKFTVGRIVRVRNAAFTQQSPEVKVVSVVGVTVTVASTLGFTPNSTHVAEAMPFPDGQDTYRIF
jgi:hypothetical protein